MNWTKLCFAGLYFNFCLLALAIYIKLPKHPLVFCWLFVAIALGIRALIEYYKEG